MIKTKCVHCKDEFERWDDYARHILDGHPDDKLRADWARSCLAEPPAEVSPKKFGGRPLNRIPPRRLSRFLRRQPDGEKSSNNKSD